MKVLFQILALLGVLAVVAVYPTGAQEERECRRNEVSFELFDRKCMRPTKWEVVNDDGKKRLSCRCLILSLKQCVGCTYVQKNSTESPLLPTTGLPPITTDRPVITTDLPVTATDLPVTTDRPVVTTDLPVTTDRPVVTTDLPVTTDRPVVTTDLPVTTDRPVITTDLPVTTGSPDLPTTGQPPAQ